MGALGPDRLIGIGRELTKAHEELVVRPISEALLHFADPRGEFTVLVPPLAGELMRPALPSREDLHRELGEMTSTAGRSKRTALRTIAERYAVSVNALYRILEGGEAD
jgi:16S rRNA (cytidine1402-2'-O)-methyltransferase